MPQKTRESLLTTREKLHKLSKEDCEKEAYETLKRKTAHIIYDLNIADAQCTTVYGLAFCTEETQLIHHLKYAKRALRANMNSLTLEAQRILESMCPAIWPT